MKVSKFIFWLKPILVLSIVCSFALTATAQNHFPAVVGNNWVLLSADGAEQRTYAFEGPETVDGKEFILFNIIKETVGTDAVASDKSWVTVEADGEILLHQVAFDRGAFGIAEATWDPPVTNFPAALPLGHKWEIVTETVLKLVGAATTTSTLEVIAIEDVETPLGVFKDCVKLETNRKAVTALTVIREHEFLWLAPDMGPVKFQDTNEIVFDLASYNLVEPAAEVIQPTEETTADVTEETTEEGTEEPTADVTEETTEEGTEETTADVTEETTEEGTEEPTADVTEETTEEGTEETTADVTEETTEEVTEETTADVTEETTEEVTEEVTEETTEEGTEVETPAEPTVEEPMVPKEYGFDVTLEPGLNMISIPLMPEAPYTAKSLAAMLNSTLVIRLDVATQEFSAYTSVDEGDGFSVEGGMGYIVNTPTGGMVKFTGTAWDNQSEAADDAPAAPTLSTQKNTWAFVVTSTIRDMETGTSYILVAENLRTGIIATENVTSTAKRSAAVWADLNRKSVVEAGDKLEVALYDERGNIVSGPFQRTVSTADIRNAFLSLQLNVGDVRPKDTVLAQNYPNPFNPETWIPYQLSKSAEVSIHIHNVAGHLIRTLDLGLKPTGAYMTPSTAAYWDGKNAVGEHVASGVYFYTLQTADFAATRRMVILK